MSSASSPSLSETAAGWPIVDWRARLPWTWFLAAVMVVVHVCTAVWQWWRGYEDLGLALVWERSDRFRAAIGGQLDLLVDSGEVWRLATSTLLHGDGLHLAVNAVAIVVLGRLVEPMLGGLRVWVWFSLGAVLASAGSHLTGVHQSDGASGGAYALLGAMMVVGLRLRSRLSAEDRRLLGPILWGFAAFNLVLSAVLPFVDIAAHVFGLAVGMALGAVTRLGDDGTPARWARVIGVVWLVVYVLACGFGFAFSWLELAL